MCVCMQRRISHVEFAVNVNHIFFLKKIIFFFIAPYAVATAAAIAVVDRISKQTHAFERVC